MTLADEDTNSILTDNANRAIQGNVAGNGNYTIWLPTLELMQVTSPDYPRFNFVEPTNASGAIWWTNLQPMQVAPSGGQIWN